MIEISSYTLSGPAPGPHLLVFGAIHGEEICGPKAIEKFLDEDHTLKRGTLTLVPICNPLATQQNVAYLEANLNRVFQRRSIPLRYEEKLAQKLIPFVHAADYLLDLHSFSAEGAPYLFLDYDTEENRRFAQMLGISRWVVGWPELYVSRPDLEATGAVDYAHQIGKPSILVECGQHLSSLASDRAYISLRRALHGLEMLSFEFYQIPAIETRAKVTDVVICDKFGFFAKEWKNFDEVKKGEIIIVYNDGAFLRAPFDGYVILPRKNAQIGDEWIYFGRAVG